jgi:WD40 repeat protein
MITKLLQRIVLVISLSVTPFHASMQPPSPSEITVTNVYQLKLIRQLGYGSIIDTAFSPDGKHFAVGTETGVALYNVENFSELPRFFEGGGGDIAFSPDNAVLASQDHLWDVTTGNLVYKFDGYSPVFSADGSRLIFVSGQEIVAMDRGTGDELLRETFSEDIHEIKLSTDDETLALDFSGDIVLWSLETGMPTVELDIPQYPTMYSGETVFSPDGKKLFHAGFDGYVLWDAETGEVIRFQDTWFNPDLDSAAFSWDGSQIAIGDANAGISLIDAKTGEFVSSFSHEDEVWSVAFNPDGNLLAAAGANGIIHIWNTDTGEEYAELTGYSSIATVLSFNATDAILSAASIGGASWQWDLNTGEQISAVQGYKFYVSHGTVPYPSTIELNRQGNLLATGSVINGNIHLWTPKGQSRGNLEMNGDVLDVAFTPDSSIIAALGYENIYMWELETGSRITGLLVGDRPLAGMTFSPDGNLLAVGDRTGRVMLQDRITARVIAEFQGTEGDVTNLTFSPDGTMLAFTNYCWRCSPNEYDYSIRLWDANTGERLHHLEGHTNFVEGLAFTSDGTALVSAARDGTLRFWNLVTGEELAVLEAWASALAFSSDGTMLATNSTDGTIHLWGVVE